MRTTVEAHRSGRATPSFGDPKRDLLCSRLPQTASGTLRHLPVWLLSGLGYTLPNNRTQGESYPSFRVPTRNLNPPRRGRYLARTWDTDKLAHYGIVTLVVYSATAGIFRAASKPFWFDEICSGAAGEFLSNLRRPPPVSLWFSCSKQLP